MCCRDEQTEPFPASPSILLPPLPSRAGREINEEEFLKEVTSSELVVCHFFHKDFERCKIMDMVRALVSIVVPLVSVTSPPTTPAVPVTSEAAASGYALLHLAALM